MWPSFNQLLCAALPQEGTMWNKDGSPTLSACQDCRPSISPGRNKEILSHLSQSEEVICFAMYSESPWRGSELICPLHELTWQTRLFPHCKWTNCLLPSLLLFPPYKSTHQSLSILRCSPKQPQQGRFPDAYRLSMQYFLTFHSASWCLIRPSSLRAASLHLPMRAKSTTPTPGFESLCDRKDLVQHVQVHLGP